MRKDWGATTTRTVDLGYEQLLVLQTRPGMRVRVLYGQVWLTEEGDGQDRFAAGGEELALRSCGCAVAEGLGAARVQVTEERRPRAPAALWPALSRALRAKASQGWQRLRRWAGRGGLAAAR
jgi:Protein of unknown function (DUF2917)